MATNNPVGMGYNTRRQFNRVASDIMKFVNGVYDYNESDPVGNHRYGSQGTIRNGVIKYKPKFDAPQLPKFHHMNIPTPSPPIRRERVPHKPSR